MELFIIIPANVDDDHYENRQWNTDEWDEDEVEPIGYSFNVLYKFNIDPIHKVGIIVIDKETLLWHTQSFSVRNFWSRVATEELEKKDCEPVKNLIGKIVEQRGLKATLFNIHLLIHFGGYTAYQDGRVRLDKIFSSFKEEMPDKTLKAWTYSSIEEADGRGTFYEVLAPSDDKAILPLRDLVDKLTMLVMAKGERITKFKELLNDEVALFQELLIDDNNKIIEKIKKHDDNKMTILMERNFKRAYLPKSETLKPKAVTIQAPHTPQNTQTIIEEIEKIHNQPRPAPQTTPTPKSNLNFLKQPIMKKSNNAFAIPIIILLSFLVLAYTINVLVTFETIMMDTIIDVFTLIGSAVTFTIAIIQIVRIKKKQQKIKECKFHVIGIVATSQNDISKDDLVSAIKNKALNFKDDVINETIQGLVVDFTLIVNGGSQDNPTYIIKKNNP